MATSLYVLILEDRPADAELMLHELRQAGYQPDWRRVETEPDYVAHLEPTLDVILADYSLPQFNALRALQLLQEQSLDIPFIVVTGTIGEEAAVECMKQGAVDYLLKDRLARLGPAVAHVLEQKRLRDAKRQTEEALRESEARYRAVVEDQTELICRFRPDGTLTFVNDAYCRYFGQTREALMGRLFTPLVSEGDREMVQKQSIALGRDNPLVTYEHRVSLLDGQVRWQQWTNRAIFDEQGRLAEFQAVGRDITVSKQADGQIKRLNQDLERRARGLAALNRAGQIMASTLDLDTLLEQLMEQTKNLLDAEGASVLLRARAAEKADSELVFAAVTGAAAEKLINRRIPITAGIGGWVARERRSALVADAQNDPRLDHSLDAVTGLTTRSLLAVPLISKGSVLGVVEAINNVGGTFDQHDLEVLEALASSAAIAIENARLFSMLNQEKRRLEFLHHLSQHLVESLDMGEVAQRALDGLRAVAALLRGLVVVRESPPMDGSSSGERDLLRLVAVSGYDAESVEALNQRLQLRVGDGLTGWVAAQRQLAVIDDVIQDPRWMAISGLDEWVRSALSVPLLSGDDLLGVLSIYSERAAFFTPDIRQLVESAAAAVAVAIANARLFSTERQRVAELARALEQQRELDRLQREFIQNVSHELRTPLALIRGHAEVLESGWLGDLQPEQKDSIGVITRRTQMLGRLVDDIMSILEVERRELKQESVDLAQLIRTSLADFQPAAQRAGLTLSADIAPDLPAVPGDVIALRRALDNLVGNAFKFTRAGGRIAVCLSRSEATARLEVVDTGIGISSEHLGRIFERFYQVDGSTTRKYGGVGLGLALVKGIIEAHGGQIAVASEVGVGTTFIIVLPFSR